MILERNPNESLKKKIQKKDVSQHVTTHGSIK